MPEDKDQKAIDKSKIEWDFTDRIAKTSSELRKLVNMGYNMGYSTGVLRGLRQGLGTNFKGAIIAKDLLIDQDILVDELKKAEEPVKEPVIDKDCTCKICANGSKHHSEYKEVVNG